MWNFQAMLKAVIDDAEFVGEEAIKAGEHLLEFAGLVTPSLLPVATDVLTDIAAGTVTPAQIPAQLADATAMLKAAQGAVTAIKATDVAPAPAPAAQTTTYP